MKIAIWMKVTKDKYEFPLVTANSSRELAKKLGVFESTVSSTIRKAKQCGSKCQYVKVEIDDDED